MNFNEDELLNLKDCDKFMDKIKNDITSLNKDDDFYQFMTDEEDQRRMLNSLVDDSFDKGVNQGITQGIKKANIDKTIKDWLENVEPEKREQVIDAVFEILNTTEAQTMKELKANWFANVKTILGTYKNIDNDTKEMVWQTVNELLKVAKNNIFEELPKIADN